eukprot:TRINITY_DN6711_c0_g1_i2.p1 TRINITY_DN6711_c0_g1~~TRINITY_DN6711_c0_g1_i2.p1  ORF type:complete len:103 (-),score=36.08 TRINITY_DN6711_c0_g1_i2:90-398(-)
MSSPGGSSSSRARTCSESSEGELVGVRPSLGGVSYDVDGKFSFSQVMKSKLMGQMKTTVDENGKFDYIHADMNPVPPGWYDLDRSKHAVPRGWYATAGAGTK